MKAVDEAAEDRKLLELDASAKAFNTGKALPPNADHVEDHEFLTPKEISLISEIIQRITKNVLENDLEVHFPDASPGTKPKAIKLPSGVSVAIEPGQTLTLGANGEVITAASGDCDPESDPSCVSSQVNGRDSGSIHVHLSNGTTVNYNFKKSNQLDPVSIDAKERALKIKLYVTAATALDDILFRKVGSDEIMKDKVRFEEVFLEELGKKLRDESLLIPTNDGRSNPSGILGNENSIPNSLTMEKGTGESLSTAVDHYMGLLSSEQNRNHGPIGTPMPLSDRMDVGAVGGYLVGGTAGAVVFLAIMFVSAHWLEACEQDAGRLPTC
ncbi:unnamed protein product [Notodromas monacha]|uniref:Uncharacterized protein n=1 Tax=Notodromas monacha TaxID=399045 RepID=A0A7R9GHZ2_9CRUS|nr:unnamed protein product [Notodromas monacha]CAG0921870.1 unnamed protein product [Notodromas monacha]